MYSTPSGVAQLSCSILIYYFLYMNYYNLCAICALRSRTCFVLQLLFETVVLHIPLCVAYFFFSERPLCTIYLQVLHNLSGLFDVQFCSIKIYILHCLDGYVVLFFIVARCVLYTFWCCTTVMFCLDLLFLICELWQSLYCLWLSSCLFHLSIVVLKYIV